MDELLIQLLINGIMTAGIYALIAIGFSLIYNTTHIFHFAHAAVYVACSYCFYTLCVTWEFPVWLGICFSLIFSAAFGMMVDILLYQPLEKRGAVPLVIMLVSLGFYSVTVNSLVMIFGSEPRIVFSGIQEIYDFEIARITVTQFINGIASLLVSIAILLALKFTWAGKLIKAMRDDQELLSTLGVNLTLLRSGIFAIGSLLVGLAAILWTIDVGIEPHNGMPMFIFAAIAVIIGGVSVFKGALLGALIVGVFYNVSTLFLPASWREIPIFLLLILFLFFRPQGLLGKRQRAEEQDEKK